MKLLDLTAKTFGRLTVTSRAENTSQGQARWNCVCECGAKITVPSVVLRDGRSRSCGCLKHDELKKRSTRHGHSAGKQSPTYYSWAGMVGRCTNPSHTAFSNYGGRGVLVCDRWLDFNHFLADMGEKPAGMSIDRIDNLGNYAPGNCRWSTLTQQARNKRNSRKLTHDGLTLTVPEWAERLGLPAARIHDRLSRGYSAGDALSTSIHPQGMGQHRLRRG